MAAIIIYLNDVENDKVVKNTLLTRQAYIEKHLLGKAERINNFGSELLIGVDIVEGEMAEFIADLKYVTEMLAAQCLPTTDQTLLELIKNFREAVPLLEEFGELLQDGKFEIEIM